MSAKLDKLFDRVDSLKADYNAAKSLQDQVLALHCLSNTYHRIVMFFMDNVADRHVENVAAIKKLASRIAELESQKQDHTHD